MFLGLRDYANNANIDWSVKHRPGGSDINDIKIDIYEAMRNRITDLAESTGNKELVDSIKSNQRKYSANKYGKRL